MNFIASFVARNLLTIVRVGGIAMSLGSMFASSYVADKKREEEMDRIKEELREELKEGSTE